MARKKPESVHPEYARWLDGLRERVRTLRGSKGWSLREAAKHVGVPYQTLHRLESGSVEPSMLFAWDVAAGYGVAFDWLICGCDPSKPPARKPRGK